MLQLGSVLCSVILLFFFLGKGCELQMVLNKLYVILWLIRMADLCYLQYGRIAHIDLKVPPRPPGYAFVEVSLELFFFFFCSSLVSILFNYCGF